VSLSKSAKVTTDAAPDFKAMTPAQKVAYARQRLRTGQA